MTKRLTLAAVAAVGIVGIAAWSVAQPPGGTSSGKPPLNGASTSGTSTGETTDSGAASGIKPSATSSSSPRITPSSGLPSTKSSSSFIPPGTTSSGGRSPVTSSRGLPDLDSSLPPSRGGSSSKSDLSPGSSLSAGATIRIDHALVTSLDSIKLPAREAGAIRTIAVKKGVNVKADEVLGQLDDRDSQTKKKIAELERDAAKVQAESDAQVDAAKKGEEVTRLNYQANEELNKTKQGAISPFDLRRSWFEWQRALAQIAVAEVEKAVAQATQLAKEGQIEGALNEIERRKIVAPIDGFVNEVYKHQGEWCQPGDPVMELIRMDRVEIEGFVYAADASPAKVLNKPVDVVVQIADGQTYKASGTITFASPVLEGSGRIRQFRVSTEIDNKKEGDNWIIQVGTEAEMIIHLNPPAPKPVVAPKTSLPSGSKSKSSLPGTKVESYKPAIPDTDAKGDTTKAGTKTETKSGAKTESKPEGKSDEKAKAKDTKADAAKADAADKTESNKPVPPKTEKSDAGKADSSKPAADSGKNGKSGEPADADEPAKKDEKRPAKTSKIRV